MRQECLAVSASPADHLTVVANTSSNTFVLHDKPSYCATVCSRRPQPPSLPVLLDWSKHDVAPPSVLATEALNLARCRVKAGHVATLDSVLANAASYRYCLWCRRRQSCSCLYQQKLSGRQARGNKLDACVHATKHKHARRGSPVKCILDTRGKRERERDRR